MILEGINKDPLVIRVDFNEPPGPAYTVKLVSLIIMASECKIDSVLLSPPNKNTGSFDRAVNNIIDNNQIVRVANDKIEPKHDGDGNYIIFRSDNIVCMRDSSKSDKYSIDMTANMDNVGFVAKIAALITNIMGFPGFLSFGVRFTVYELLNNIVEHGVYQDGKELINIDLEREGDKLAVSLDDEGIEFDPTKCDEFDLESYLRSGGKRGLGLMMLKKMNKTMQYARDNKHNRLSFERVIPRQAPSGKEETMSSLKVGSPELVDGGAYKISLKGDLDSKGALILEETMNTLIDKKILNIILDLEELDFVSSAGVGMLLGLVSSLKREKGRVIFVNVSQRVKSVFNLLNLNDYFEFSSLDKAINRQ